MDMQPEKITAANEIKALERVLPFEVVQAAGAEYSEELEKAETEGKQDIATVANAALKNLHDSMAHAVEGANKAIEAITMKYKDVADPEYTLQERATLHKSNLLLQNIAAVESQKGLIAFVLESSFDFAIATRIGLIRSEFKKLSGFLRTHKITGMDFDKTITILERHAGEPAFQAKAASLYSFLRYLNYLRANRVLVGNIIYACYTASAISISVATNHELTLTKVLTPVLKEKQKISAARIKP